MARNMFAIIGDRFSYFVSERPRGSNVVRAGLPLPKGHGVHIRLKPWRATLGSDSADIHSTGSSMPAMVGNRVKGRNGPIIRCCQWAKI